MNVFSTLFLISALNGVFLIFVLLTQNWKKLGVNIFLILLLAIISGYLGRDYLYLQGKFIEFPHLMAAFVPLFYLIGPLYYFYVKFSIQKGLRLQYKNLVHTLPAIVCFLTILPFYLLSGVEKIKRSRIAKPEDFEFESNRIFYYGFLLISLVYYVVKAYQLIRSKRGLKNGKTTKHLRAKMVWLQRYTEVFLLFIFLFLTAHLVFILTDFYPYYMRLSTVLASSLLIHFVGYWALRESRIMQTEPEETDVNLSQDQIEKYKHQLVTLMEKDKLYQHSDLTIDLVAKKLLTNSKYLSYLINKEFNCSYTYYINAYRIQESKNMISSAKYEHLNLLGVACSVGFNTKNTFTRVFKKHTGITPSEFRNNLKK